MIERTLDAHAYRNTFHLNGNLLIAGMTAATVASWAAPWAGARLSSPEALTAVSTAVGVLTFVPLYFLLRYLHTASIPDSARTGPRTWQGVELVHVMGAMRLGILLGLHVASQYALIRLGMRADHACLVAYMLAHASSHAVHGLLLRITATPRAISYSGQRVEPWQWPPGHAGAANASAMERGAGGS